jgi:hypothetical protein
MNPIVEETALPTTTSYPDVEPTFVEGKALSPRLDRQEYEYDDEPSTIDHVLDSGQSMRSIGTLDGESYTHDWFSKGKADEDRRRDNVDSSNIRSS